MMAEVAAKLQARRQDKQDFYNELVGRPAGRMRRFFHGKDAALHAQTEENNNSDLALNLVVQSLEADLQARMEALRESVALADAASYEALMEARERFEQAQQEMKTLQNNAHVLPDGRRVYLSEDGSYAIDEDENRLTEDEMAQVEWEAGHTTAEQYREGRNKLDGARQEVDKIQGYRDRLEAAREKLENGEGLSEEELDGLEDDITSMPDAVRDKFQAMGGKPLEASSKSEQQVSQSQGLRSVPPEPSTP